MERVRAGFDARMRILPAEPGPGAFFRVQWRETPVARARACFLLASSEHAVVVWMMGRAETSAHGH